MVVVRQIAGVTGHGRRHHLVVERKVGLTKRNAVESRVAETQGRGTRPFSQDVFDILDADVAWARDLVDGTGCGELAEELGEEYQTHGFAAKRSPACGESFEVLNTRAAEACEARRQLARLGARLLGYGCQTMCQIFDVLVGVPAALMRNDEPGAEKRGHVVVSTADQDRLVDQEWRDGIEVSVEAYAKGLADGRGVDVVGIERDVLDGAQGPALVVL